MKKVLTVVCLGLMLLATGCDKPPVSEGQDVKESRDEKVEFEKINFKEIDIVEKDIKVLLGYDTIEELTNNDKLYIALESYASKSGLNNMFEIKTVKKSDVINAFQNTIFGDLDLEHEDVLCECKSKLFVYNKEKEEYVYNEEHGGHGFCKVYKEFTKLVDFYEKDGQYIASYKYAFGNYCEDDSTQIFGSYSDAEKQKNPIYNDDILSQETEDTVKQDYEEIKDKLMTYTYTFEKVGGKIKIVDFKRS